MSSFDFSPLKKRYPIAALLLGVLFLYTLGMGARRVVLEAQYRKVGDQLPFTLESALQYRRIKMVHDTGLLPTRDIMIQFPDGVDNRRQYNLSSEYVYPWLARFFPGEVPFPNRLRWLEAGWFCMGIPFLFLWIRLWRRNWWAAGVGAAFYAVALSSVMRSTGQELSRENFALPILILHYLLDALYPRCRGRWASGLVQVGSAVVLALALACWDLIQYPVMLRMAWMAYDRVVHGVSHRWAYIALSGARDPASNAHFQTIADFASRLHPALLKPD